MMGLAGMRGVGAGAQHDEDFARRVIHVAVHERGWNPDEVSSMKECVAAAGQAVKERGAGGSLGREGESWGQCWAVRMGPPRGSAQSASEPADI